MNSLLKRTPSNEPEPLEEYSAPGSLPTAADYAASARRRARNFLLGGILLALVIGSAFVGLNKLSLPSALLDNIVVPLVLLVIFVVPILIWRYPQFILYLVLASVCLFELYLMPFSDSLTDRIPVFWNVNTIFQVYAQANFKGVPLNLLEVLLLTAGACSLLRSVYTRTTQLRVGELLWPIAIYLSFVGIGWVNGLATGGDFKISLQEVRSQFYFGLAYLLAVNIIRDRRQLHSLLWVMVVCIGLKGILYTFRRYVTLQGLPLPDQGVGSHEEAFLFDTFVCLLLTLLICGTFPKLRWTMLALLPFVALGNLACNRRASTAAFIIIVPLLFLAVYQALPLRRRLIGVIAAVSTVVFFSYFMAFRNSSSAIGQPAHAINSQFSPDPRDASSNAYRDAENADLMATIKFAPLGYGYGKRMLHAVPIADISQDYDWWDIMTHNQVLWVWMRVGSFGFLAFWMMVSAIIICAGRTIRKAQADIEIKSVAITGMLIVASLMIFGLLDLQFSNFRDMLFAGLWSGILAALPSFVSAKGPLESAPVKGPLRVRQRGGLT